MKSKYMYNLIKHFFCSKRYAILELAAKKITEKLNLFTVKIKKKSDDQI
jgi:hypothetical protein